MLLSRGFMRLAVAILAVSSSADATADANGKYWIYGEGIAAAFIPYGASISNLIINDKYGIPRDLVMGFDNASYYAADPVHPHLGGVPGRYANRIKNSTFTIDGDKYRVSSNENPTADHPSGLNTLHGGKDGWDWRYFNVVAHRNHSVTFSIVDLDGKEGFPGEVISYITYTMCNMTWDAKMVAIATTRKTPIMLTSHTYWNLDGFSNDKTSSVLNHTLHMPYSGQRVAVDNILIPTGEIAANARGSVNDFWSGPKQIGAGFGDAEIHGNCGHNCTGYDNCWLVNRNSPHDWRADGNYVASLASAWSGIQLDVYSDQAAFQMYSCNFQDGSFPLKMSQGVGRNASRVLPGQPAAAPAQDAADPAGGGSYGGRQFPRTVPKYGCLVMEVQDWIDGINHPEWGRMEKQVFGPGSDPYVLQVSHRFIVG